jgi:hypothetical protein
MVDINQKNKNTDEEGEEDSMKMNQVEKRSGSLYHVNLDPISAKSMHEAVEYYTGSGTPVSLSVLARRAFRLYKRYLDSLQSEGAKQGEERELLRAGRGLQ